MDFNINTLVHTKMMKYSALLALDGNNGHFVNELDRTTSEGREIVKVDIIIILDMIIPSFPVDTRLSRTRITSFCRYIMTSACLFTVRVGQRQPSSLVVYSGSWPRQATCWMFRRFFVAQTHHRSSRYWSQVPETTSSDTRVKSPACEPDAPVSVAHQWCKYNAIQSADPRTEQRNLRGHVLFGCELARVVVLSSCLLCLRLLVCSLVRFRGSVLLFPWVLLSFWEDV